MYTQYLCISVICLFAGLLWWSDRIMIREGLPTEADLKSKTNFQILSTISPPSPPPPDREDDRNSNKVVILMWGGYYRVDPDVVLNEFILSGRKWDANCCFSWGRVEVTLDRSQINRAMVVVFFGYFDNLNKDDLPPERPPGQIWVLFLKESPRYSPGFGQFNGMFNWTMTYRRDSDIWAPYGETLELEEPLPENATIIMPSGLSLDEWIQNKPKLFTGVMTNCKTPSKREMFIKLLRESVGNKSVIDIYGDCGKPICPRTVKSCNHTKFWTDLASTYKFYLAAENSLCEDYITEKFWRTLDVGMVPVVYGGAYYKTVAPPNSFIDVRDFKSFKELAEHLQMLDKKPEEYAKLFQWRRKYSVRLSDAWAGWCKLCKMSLDYHDGKYLPEAKTYNNLSYWWLHVAPVDMKMDEETPKKKQSYICTDAIRFLSLFQTEPV